MSVIIRLQNLPWSANALDIRQYFQGLSIPEGGVHIVGGELGDAFIAFSTDEDARQAFNMTKGRIKEVQIKLMLSSRTEMQKVIEAARNQSMAAFIGNPTAPTPTNVTPTPVPSLLVAPPPPSLTTPTQSSHVPLTQVQQTTAPPSLGTLQSILPALVPEVQPFGDSAVQNQQLQEQQKLLQQQLQQVQQQTAAKDSKDSSSRDRRRSRSRSRDRRDRKRDKRRSRSRSRDRRDRRRRDRSRSRDRRSSSRDRDRRSRDNTRKLGDKNNAANKSIGVWENPPPRIETNLLQNQTTLQLLGSLLPNANLLNLDPAVASLLPVAFEPWTQSQSILPEIHLNNDHNQSSIVDGDSSVKLNNRDRNRDRERDRDRGRDRDRDRDRDRNRDRDREQNSDQRNSSTNSLDISHDSRGNSEDSRRLYRSSRGDGEKNACVRLFPYYGGFGEVRRFFSGLYINSNGIKFALSAFGEQTGVVLVRFTTFKDKEKGLEFNGQAIKGMEVKISNLSDEDFDNAKDPEATVNSIDLAFKNDPFTCLVVEDLPPFTTNHHLLKMFSDYSIINIYIVQKQRAPSVGYIKFGTTEDAHKALQDISRHSVEGKRVNVGPCKDEIFEGIRKMHEGDQEQEPLKMERDGATLYILLTDLPQKSNDRDVADFFSDLGIIPANIFMVRNDNGIYNGQTYCEFFTIDEARVAYQKKGMPMGTGTVNMTYVTKQFMEMNIKGTNNGSPSNDIILNHNIPRVPVLNPLMGGPGIMGLPGMPVVPRHFFPRGMPRGMGMPGPMGPRGMMRMPRLPMNMHPRMNMRFMRPPHMMAPMQLNSPQQQQSQQQQYEDEEEIAPPGCTLLMENVPFKAELDEILDFFDGFDVAPENILRKYDSQGRPSGETKVIFNSPEEVFHVLQERRGHKIRDRNIYLSQC